MDGNNRSRKMQVSVKKMEYSREYKRLKLQEEFLEKNLASTIKSMKIDADSIRQIAEEKLKGSAQRESKTEEMASSILDMVKELNWLKSTVQGGDPSALRNLDISDCGSRLTKLSNRIENLKAGKSQLDVLAREEESLDSDLREFGRSIFAERIQPPTKNWFEHKCPSRSEVNDQFTELVARTGHTQGWSDEDHSLFLKARKNCDSVPRMVTEIRKKRPHLTNEDVVNHEAWYKLYKVLRDNRKREIAEWRLRNSGVSNDDRASYSCEKGSENERKEKASGKEERKKCPENGTDNNDKKKMIEEWRAERLRKSAMDEEQKERLERAKIVEQNRRRDFKRREAMIKLRNYREKKAADQRGSSTNLKSVNKQTTRDSQRLIKSFREQDEKFVRKKLSRMNLEMEKMAKNRDTKSGHNSTLFKPTKVWEEKCKRNINAVDLSFGKVNYVKDIPRLSSSSSSSGPREVNRIN